ncbi:pteridine reductase [Rheinheimera sp. UJ51]|uniref:pteridine reductase n=1 Tax=unclassified Rheinheimera TaxID=115860 RepID=UPI001E587889|nr:MULTISPECIES: pteridine reductase [unclassified Rheinheimera]MCC5451229.1 pteridine reductase [Rheinheimera sp. UJ51]MCF4009983.1 pteridine reductase [Rheinheimera sp. UJ63]
MTDSNHPVALVTGSALRLGKQMIISLHQQGYRVLIHYRRSAAAAEQLAAQLNQLRANSAATLCANLTDDAAIAPLAQQAIACFGRLDLLVNNASSFYPTPLANAQLDDWQELFGSNVKAPYFLSKALSAELTKRQGCIINMVDIHADKPLAEHSIYCMAKAALQMMTKALARELAPAVRVNGIAPGAILWPSQALDDADKDMVLQQVPLARLGEANDIANTLLFLAQAPYITGQIVAVDGGRSLGGANKA